MSRIIFVNDESEIRGQEYISLSKAKINKILWKIQAGKFKNNLAIYIDLYFINRKINVLFLTLKYFAKTISLYIRCDNSMRVKISDYFGITSEKKTQTIEADYKFISDKKIEKKIHKLLPKGNVVIYSEKPLTFRTIEPYEYFPTNFEINGGKKQVQTVNLAKTFSDNILTNIKKYMGDILIVNGKIKMNATIGISENSDKSYVIFYNFDRTFKSPNSNADFWKVPFVIRINPNNLFTYINIISKSEKYSGTEIVNTVLLLLKKFGVKYATINDGASITLSKGEKSSSVSLSLVKAITEGRTFYQKFGFRFQEAECLKNNPGCEKDAEQKKFSKYISELSNLKLSDILREVKGVVKILDGKDLCIIKNSPNTSKGKITSKCFPITNDVESFTKNMLEAEDILKEAQSMASTFGEWIKKAMKIPEYNYYVAEFIYAITGGYYLMNYGEIVQSSSGQQSLTITDKISAVSDMIYYSTFEIDISKWNHPEIIGKGSEEFNVIISQTKIQVPNTIATFDYANNKFISDRMINDRLNAKKNYVVGDKREFPTSIEASIVSNKKMSDNIMLYVYGLIPELIGKNIDFIIPTIVLDDELVRHGLVKDNNLTDLGKKMAPLALYCKNLVRYKIIAESPKPYDEFLKIFIGETIKYSNSKLVPKKFNGDEYFASFGPKYHGMVREYFMDLFKAVKACEIQI